MKGSKLKSIQGAISGSAITRRELLDVLQRFADSELNAEEILKELCDRKILREFRFRFPHRTHVVFAQPSSRLPVVLMGINPSLHLSHAAAMDFHGLADKPPARTYVNIEQQAGSRPNAVLTQGAIDATFKRPPRVSSNIVKFGKDEICLLSGKNTRYFGVENFKYNQRTPVRVTSMERTLVDIVNRPSYAGGVEAVLSAFRRAQGRISIRKLAETLRKVDHLYPYHQCIGFLLEHSGNYSESDIAPFREQAQDFDFYLTHQIPDSSYIPQWRLHVPSSLLTH